MKDADRSLAISKKRAAPMDCPLYYMKAAFYASAAYVVEAK